ncbi:hypothetical protein RSAG8_07087, partial [Rhizoctonia solani AG-8 WAC10335]
MLSVPANTRPSRNAKRLFDGHMVAAGVETVSSNASSVRS